MAAPSTSESSGRASPPIVSQTGGVIARSVGLWVGAGMPSSGVRERFPGFEQAERAATARRKVTWRCTGGT